MKTREELAEKCHDMAMAKYDGAKKMMEKALEYEVMALQLLNKNKPEPSRTVLYRSAISIALEIGKAGIATTLADEILNDNPHPEIAEEIRELMKGILR